MVAEKKTSKLDRLNAISDPLEAARQMHQDWLNYGTDFIHLYVEDVEGVGFENWDEDEEDLETETDSNLALEKFEKTTLDFFNSDDPVALKVRGDIIEAKVTNKNEKKNRVTYEIAGAIKLTENYSKGFNKVEEGKAVKVEILKIENGKVKKVKYAGEL